MHALKSMNRAKENVEVKNKDSEYPRPCNTKSSEKSPNHEKKNPPGT
jgi:hypothetical protein